MRKKAFRLYSTYLKQQFGGRVHKISIDAGFGCPNRHGGRDGHGCLFCDPGGSGAVGISALLHRKISPLGRHVAVVVSGGNIEAKSYLATLGRLAGQ